MGLKVVDQATVVLTSIDPPFGWVGAPTAVTITAAGGLLPTPRVYLNPHTAAAASVATALSSVAFVSATQVTAIVPKGLDPAADPYDVIVVNPDGTVGVLTMPMSALYRSEVNPPPVVDGISPGSVPTSGAPPVTISGANFRMPTVTFTCNGAAPFTATITSSNATTIVVDIATQIAGVGSPNVCTIRVTDGDDMTYGDFSALAVSNPSGNLSAPMMGTQLPVARRAPSLVGGQATRAARFLYVIGGDSGMSSGALDSVVTTTADEKGTGAAWFTQRYALNAKRTLAGAATLGRYIYIAGGNDGTGPVKTVERAIVLDPTLAPTINDVDIVPGMGMGLGGGIWYYRVAALMDPNDPDNPGGEALPSDETTLQIPDLAQKLQITLTWSAVTGAVGYRIYRSPQAGLISGQEQMIADVMGANTITYTDKGAMADATQPPPLVQGSTGKWRVLPAMSTNRESPGVVFGTDPSNPNQHYLYATLGLDTAALGTYEFLPVTVGANSSQTFGAWTAGAHVSAQPRYQHMAYSASDANASFVPANTNYIYLGGGTANGTSSLMVLEAGQVSTGGDLGTFGAAGTTIKSFGSGAAVAANYLYTFGDDAPSGSIRAGQIVSGGAPALANFNNNGGGLLTPRYLPGCALQGALIYLAGGSNAGKNSATTSVEWMVW
jgi:hypothetical protein